MRDPHLYVMCGLPFAGKSTLARRLVDMFGWTYISMDAINDEFGQGFNGAAISAEGWDKTYSEAYRRIGEALRAGQTVVYDAPNHLRVQRDDVKVIASTHHAEMTVILVDVPAQVATERWQRNRETVQRPDVRDDDFMLVIGQFEPPTSDERVLRYDQSLPLEKWLQAHFPSDTSWTMSHFIPCRVRPLVNGSLLPQRARGLAGRHTTPVWCDTVAVLAPHVRNPPCKTATTRMMLVAMNGSKATSASTTPARAQRRREVERRPAPERRSPSIAMGTDAISATIAEPALGSFAGAEPVEMRTTLMR
jgi:predicted kinase